MSEKKRTVEELELAIRDTPQQDLAPLLAELEEAKAAEKPKATKDKGY